jgi:uncharacterized membrane protein (UPF0127 family)
MKKEIIIHYKKKGIKLIAKDCNLLQKSVGLMFSRREKAKILLFKFKNMQKIRIHSFFVFYPFFAVWLDEKNKVVDLKKVMPFIPCISHRGKANKLIEIPINKKYDDISALFVEN